MIIARILGGLGNQMFQYATARALALKHDTTLRLDCRDYARYHQHNGFELSRVFTLDVPLAAPSELQQVLGWRAVEPVRRALKHPLFAVLRGRSFVMEPTKGYWSGLNDLPADCYLHGYWQSARYFSHVEAALRQDFTFRTPLDGQDCTVANTIAKSQAVSLHVRRGDYASSPALEAFHGLCAPSYYRRAADTIATRVEQPVFFVFSDDVGWARQNLNLEYPCHFVDHNQGRAAANDMRLMSLCAHHVICNSSFSWWGAWLNPSPTKVVIAPQRWFAVDIDHDIVPPQWKTV